MALLLAGSAAGITQLRLEEAARAGARALARGDGHAAVDGIVRRLAGDTASAVVAEDGEWIKVTVSARVVGPLGSLIPWRLSATASARGEAPQSSAANMPLLAVGGGVVDFKGAVPMAGLQATVEEVAA
ncbi:pilus assembly protein TadE [Arthrobacter sp. B2a2-09]|nr:pilus assembly protein TadE [Arthrobacter sp. B2a2-09]